MKAGALGCALVLAGNLAAQGHPFGAPRKVQGSRVFPAGTIAADFDFDGRRDLAVGNAFSLDVRNGPASVYLLDATYKARSSENLEHTGEIGFVSHPALAAGDFNGDLLPDIVTLSDKGGVSVFVHQGSVPDPKKRPRFKLQKKFRRLLVMQRFGTAFPQFKTYDALVDDFTGDGTNDLALIGDVWMFFDVLGSSGMTILVGDGHGAFASETTVDASRFLGLASADLNGDRDPDLIGLTASNKLVQAVHRVRGQFRTTSINLSGPVNPSGLAVGDVDSDGQPDFLIAGGSSRAELVVYLGDKNGGLGKRLPVPLLVQDGSKIESLILRDLDGDHHADISLLIVPQRGNASIQFLKGTGQATFRFGGTVALEASISQSNVPPYPRFLRAIDIDGDENAELLVSSSRDAKEDKLVQWILPNRTARRWGVQHHDPATPGQGGRTPRIASVGGSPTAGNDGFTLLLAHAPGNATRAALIMSTRLEKRHNAGLTLHVFPLYAFGRTTVGEGDGGGMAQVKLAIPRDPDFVGRHYFFQWVMRDPMAPNPFGISATDALEIWIGPR